MSSALIIGAGMAGLTAARQLVQQGYNVTTLDKGRGVGGRMATRRMDAAKADHGAQYISAKTPEFHQYIESLKAAKVVTEWHLEDAHVADMSFTQPLYVGTGGMSAIAKHMAGGLRVLVNQKVVRMAADETGWRVGTESGEEYRADALLMTIPAPQALALLNDSGFTLPSAEYAALSAIVYQPCLTVMASLSQPSRIPAPGAVRYQTGDVAWIADNQQKGISPEPSVTIQASADFSRTHLEHADLNALGPQLLEQVRSWIPAESVASVQVHRWRYSQAQVRYAEPFLAAQAPFPLLFGGDGFGDGNVEGAFMSGLRMAEFLGVSNP